MLRLFAVVLVISIPYIEGTSDENLDDVRFLEAGVGKLDCSESDGEDISGETECKSAAVKLGFHISEPVQTGSYFPKGCSKYWTGYVYWNEHRSGRANSYFSPICKVEGNSTQKVWNFCEKCCHGNVEEMCAVSVFRDDCRKCPKPEVRDTDTTIMYKLAGEYQLDCSQLNGEVISNCSECKLAAGKLGYTFSRTENESNYPHGCYKYMGNNPPVYCNQHPVGGQDGYASPICKVGIPFRG